MSKLWDDLKQNMKEWSSAAVEKAEEVSKVAVAKTEELTKISKIKLEINQLQRDRRKQQEALGKLVYGQAKDNNMVNFTGNTEFYSHVEEIESISSVISEKEKEIEKIKDEYNIQESEVSANMEEAQVKDELSEAGEIKDSPESE